MTTKIIVGQVWQPNGCKATATITQVAGDQLTYHWDNCNLYRTQHEKEFLTEWHLVRDVVPEGVSEWLYSEAYRLQAVAHAAIDEYNKYIKSKPETVFIQIFK